MESRQNNNGNTQLNSTRELVNGNISRLSLLGKTKKVTWDGYRRNRSI